MGHESIDHEIFSLPFQWSLSFIVCIIKQNYIKRRLLIKVKLSQIGKKYLLKLFPNMKWKIFETWKNPG